MALGIPLPGSFGKAFTEGAGTGSDVMQRMVMNPYDMQLKQAQVQKDQAEAAKHQMLAKLMQGVSANGTDEEKRATVGWLLGIGEHPSDKRAAEVKKEKDIKTFDVNAKKQQDILDSAYVLKNAWKSYREIEKEMTARPDATGPVQGKMAEWHLSNDPVLGSLITKYATAQANLAKSSTTRPGVGAINWAGFAKMNAKDPYKINKGKLDEVMRSAKQEYDNYRHQYKDATGQEMPSFEEFMDEQQANPGSAPANNQVPQAPQAQSAPDQGAQPPAPTQAHQPPAETVQIQQAIANLPPKLRARAERAIEKGADPVAIAQRANKLLNLQGAK